MSDSKPETRKEKKKAIVEKNRQNFIKLNMHTEAVRNSAAASAAATAPSGGVPAAAAEEVVWSAKLDMIKNRITGRKQMATDRWNRFAGTSGGGGRGR